ncbi:MAG TPA: DUF1634 domain-containing protein [Burkholderiaceae bacterium]|jgi:hypothetical protein
MGRAERFVMQPSDEGAMRLEHRLARLLGNGTWIASLVVAAGLALAAIGPSGPWVVAGPRVITAGLALFVLLPVVRVVTMLIAFAGLRDHRFVGIALFVLAMIFVGFALGMEG